MKVGVLIHGLFLQAKGWEGVVWGQPPYVFGSIPKAVQVMLSFGLENISHVMFGTGASEKDGLKEAEYTHRELLQHMQRLEGYPSLAMSSGQYSRLSELAKAATLEVQSKNTQEEIVNAAKCFDKHGCSIIVQVPTCGSHAPRCIKTFLQVKEQGNIPAGQFWMVASPDNTFSGSVISDVVIVEPPHRADDLMLNAPIQAHNVVSRLLKVPPPARITFLNRVDWLLRKGYGV